MELTRIEQFSMTCKLSHALSEWEKESSHPIRDGIGARVIGVIATPFTGIIDILAHLILAAVKCGTGIFVTPYNFMARRWFKDYTAPVELELSSACTHLFLAVKSLAFIPVVAISAGFCPELAAQNADPRVIFRSKSNSLKSFFESQSQSLLS